jgi:D-aminoacyl-tRNA deacylase
MRILVESRADAASKTIAQALRTHHGFVAADHEFEGSPVEQSPHVPDAALVSIERIHVHAEGLDVGLDAAGLRPAQIVFLSRHASQSGRPTLTVHPLGNFAQARVGGESGRFTPVPAALMTNTLRRLAHYRTATAFAAEVAFEVTHHGPLLRTPAFFAELGSDEAAWRDPAGGAIVAAAVVDALQAPADDDPVLLGLGGGHYAPRFTEAALSKRVHYGHMWPRHHMMQEEDVKALAAAVAAATPGASGYHEHEGTIPTPLRRPLEEAMHAAGLARVRSRQLSPALPEV